MTTSNKHKQNIDNQQQTDALSKHEVQTTTDIMRPQQTTTHRNTQRHTITNKEQTHLHKNMQAQTTTYTTGYMPQTNFESQQRTPTLNDIPQRTRTHKTPGEQTTTGNTIHTSANTCNKK